MSSTLPSQRQRDLLHETPAQSDQHDLARRSVKRRSSRLMSSPDRRLADSSLRLMPASTGDHPMVQRFLASMLHGPSPAEFQAQLEEPTYEPLHRLLIKRGDNIVGHVRLESRDMLFGGQCLPIVTCNDMVTLPEYRDQGCDDALCEAVDERMRAEDAMMALTRTTNPQPFLRNGWVVFGRHTYSTAPVRDILSHLSATRGAHDSLFPADYRTVYAPSQQRRPLSIRLWRHVEQAALTRLYAENVAGCYGPFVRSDAYWRWLVGRRGYERLYIAIDGPDKLELDEKLEPIVGYAVMRRGRLLELMTAAGCPHARAQLLARACGDAIEQDQTTLRVDAPPADPAHQLIVAAGGQHHRHEADNGEVFLVKLPNPMRYLLGISSPLLERVRRTESIRSADLGVCLEGERFRLLVGPREVRLIPGKLGRSYLECAPPQFTQLLLGHYDLKEAIESGRISASTSVAAELGSVLFPKLPVWRPPWHDMPA